MININKLITLAQSYLDKSKIPYSIEEQEKNKNFKIKTTSDGFKICVTENIETVDSKSNIICSVFVSLNEGVNIFYDESNKINYRVEDNNQTWDQLNITTIAKYTRGCNKKEVDVITSHQVNRTINANTKNKNIRTTSTIKNIENTIIVDNDFNFLRGFKDSLDKIGSKKY